MWTTRDDGDDEDDEDNDDTYTDGSSKTFNRKEDRMVFLFLSYTSRMSEGLFRSAMKL